MIRKLFIVISFLFLKQVYAQKAIDNLDFLSQQVCECIDNTRRVNIKKVEDCKKKVFRKNKTKIEKWISEIDTSSTFGKLQKQIAPFLIRYNLTDTLYNRCETYKKVVINEAYTISKRQFIEKAHVNVCKEISSKKEQHHDIWQVLHFINEYLLENGEEYLEIARYYFYEKGRDDQSIMKFQDLMKLELQRKLKTKCKYYRQLMRELKKK